MKIKEFCKQLNKKRISSAIFMSTGMDNRDVNIDYFTGFNSEFCTLIIRPKAKIKAKLFVSQLELEAARKKSRVKVFPYNKKLISDLIKAELRNSKRIGIDKSKLSVLWLDRLRKATKKRFVDVGDIVGDLRSVKTKKELEYVKKACQYSDRILKLVVKNFKKFRTEADIASYIVYQIRKHGLSIAFEPIVASGKNASMPHHKPSRKKLQKGFMIIDFGVRYNGYCSDMTRTFFIGRANKRQKTFYELVRKVMLAGIRQSKPRVDYMELEDLIHETLGDYSQYLIHGIGHGLGLDVHDFPKAKKRESLKLKKNYVITIEPGLYFENKLGIRIENDVIVGKKPRILNRFTDKLIQLK